MSKRGFYVADADNYIMRQVVNYLSEKLDEDISIRVSYKEGIKRKKTGKITKTLNKTKPKLFRSYILKSDVLIIDLILNPEADIDVDLICQAIEKAKEIDKDIKIVVLSSYQSWYNTDIYAYYDQFKKPEVKLPSKQILSEAELQVDEQMIKTVSQQIIESNVNIEEERISNIRQKSDYDENEKESQSPIDDDSEPGVPIDYEMLIPEYFDFRMPHEAYVSAKALEDRLNRLIYVSEKVTLYYLYVGLMYGQEEQFLSKTFEKGWKQEAIYIHQDNDVKQYKIPLVDVSQIAPMILHIIDTETYVDEYKTSCDELLNSIRPPPEPIVENDNINTNDDAQDPDDPQTEPEHIQESEELKEEEEIPKGRRLVMFLDESNDYTHERIFKLLSDHIGNSTLCESQIVEPPIVNYNFKIKKNDKLLEFYETLTPGFANRIKYVIREFLIYHNLKPIKIFSHCTNTVETVLRRLSKTYNVNIIDVFTIDNDLRSFEPFKNIIQFFDETETECFSNYTSLILKTNLTDRQKRCLESFVKYRLSMNDANYNGYLLINTFAIQHITKLEQLLYANQQSSVKFKQEVERRYRKRVRDQEKAEKARIKEEKQKEREKARDRKIAEKRQWLKEEEERRRLLAKKARRHDSEEAPDDSNEEDPESETDPINEQEIELTDEEPLDDEQEPEEDQENEETDENDEPNDEEQATKHKKERFYPDHYIFANLETDDDNFTDTTLDFATLKNHSVFLQTVESNAIHNKKYEDALYHDMLIYTDREPRPYNFLPPISDIKSKFIDYFVMNRTAEANIKQMELEMQEKFAESYFEGLVNDNFKKFMVLAVKEINEKNSQVESYKKTRKFITDCFYEALNGGLLEVKKLKPEDPFEFLADYVFQHSNNLK